MWYRRDIQPKRTFCRSAKSAIGIVKKLTETRNMYELIDLVYGGGKRQLAHVAAVKWAVRFGYEGPCVSDLEFGAFVYMLSSPGSV